MIFNFDDDKKITLYQGDCMKLMCDIPDKSIDMILCDLPYGTTAAKWDSVIPFGPLWDQYKRIIKDNGAIVLFGQEPFSSHLRMSNIKMYRYDWIWEKSNPSNIANANYMPMKYHELVSVFYKKLPVFNKQMIKRSESGKKKINTAKKRLKKGVKPNIYKSSKLTNLKRMPINELARSSEYKNPSSIVRIPSLRAGSSKECVDHPTQKPVRLLNLFVRTYTNKGDIVLDNCMGSGSTAISCLRNSRNFIGMEQLPKYYDLTVKRIQHELSFREVIK